MFEKVLKNIEGRLEMPPERKAAILQELAADMEEAYREAVERGIPEREAERRVAERFAFDDETIAQLSGIHTTAMLKYARSVPGPVVSFFEKFGFVITGLGLLLYTAWIGILTAVTFTDDFNWFIIFRTVIFAVFLYLSFRLAFFLLRSKAADSTAGKRYLPVLPFLSGLLLLLTFDFVLYRLFIVFGEYEPGSAYYDALFYKLNYWGFELSFGVLTSALIFIMWFFLAVAFERIEYGKYKSLVS